MKTTIHLGSDDLAWVSRKLNAHYAMIKKSEELTEEEKNIEIGILVQRANVFGLHELIERFGYHRIEIPLTGKDRVAEFIYPKDINANDVDIVISQIELHKELQKLNS